MNKISVWFQRIIRSRTMWFNAVVAGFAALEGVFGLLQPFLPGNVFAYMTVALTVGNPIIRALWTTTALRDK